MEKGADAPLLRPPPSLGRDTAVLWFHRGVACLWAASPTTALQTSWAPTPAHSPHSCTPCLLTQAVSRNNLTSVGPSGRRGDADTGPGSASRPWGDLGRTSPLFL